MEKAEKTASISVLRDHFSRANAAFFADYKGLTVEQMNSLRRRLRPLNVRVCVVKNNLARIAVREANLGGESEQVLDNVVGPTLVTFAFGDSAAVAKSIHKFCEEHEVFALKGGLLGVRGLSPAQVEELSRLPAREVLLARFLGSLNAPASGFVGVLAAVPRSLVQVLSALEGKRRDQKA